MSTINEGVRILIDRMRTNPEEFMEGRVSKWARHMQSLSSSDWATEEEKEAYRVAVYELQRNNFTAQVLETLAGDPIKTYEYSEAMRLDSSGNLGISTRSPALTVSNGSGNASLSMPLGNSKVTISAAELAMLKKLIKK